MATLVSGGNPSGNPLSVRQSDKDFGGAPHEVKTTGQDPAVRSDNDTRSRSISEELPADSIESSDGFNLKDRRGDLLESLLAGKFDLEVERRFFTPERKEIDGAEEDQQATGYRAADRRSGETEIAEGKILRG